jgi:hypothetical protein
MNTVHKKQNGDTLLLPCCFTLRNSGLRSIRVAPARGIEAAQSGTRIIERVIGSKQYGEPDFIKHQAERNANQRERFSLLIGKAAAGAVTDPLNKRAFAG